MRNQHCRHVISLNDLSIDEISSIVDRGIGFSESRFTYKNLLSDKVVGIYFKKSSTRTRTAFSAAAIKMGGQIISYGPNDLQVNTGETINDTTMVLSKMLDCLVARTSESEIEMQTFASQNNMAVINAMSAEEHPTQAISDITTMKQHFGRISGLRVLYIGEGNNTASALSLLLPRFKNTVTYFCSPPDYSLSSNYIKLSKEYAEKSGSEVNFIENLDDLPEEVDIIYTTRWETTGSTKKDPSWKESFSPFSVTKTFQETYPNAIFMHDLPAHRGEEVAAEVIDGPQSIVFKQSENKLYSAMAILEFCLN